VDTAQGCQSFRRYYLEMKYLPLWRSISVITLVAHVSAFAAPSTYVVRRGDTLSQVALRQFGKPIYGVRGSLTKILQRNPQILNPNVIRPGEELLLQEAPSIETPMRPNDAPQASSLSDEKGYSAFFAAEPYFVFSSLQIDDTVNDSSSTLATKINVGASFIYEQKWNENWGSQMRLLVGYVSFEPPISATRTLSESSKFVSGIAAGASYSPVPGRLKIRSELEFGKKLFARGKSSTSVTVDAVALPSIILGVDYDLVKLQKVSLGMAPAVAFHLGPQVDAYKVRFGTSYSAKLYLEQRTENQSGLRVEGVYEQRRQNTSVTTQTQTNVGVVLKYWWPFGEGHYKNEVGSHGVL